VPKGFNAPSNVAQTLTNQLNSTRDQRTIKGFQGPFLAPFEKLSNTATLNANSTYADQRKHNKLSDYDAFAPNGSTIQTTQRQIPVSTILESETLRSFACGNFNTFSRENFVGYRGQDPTLVSETKLTLSATKVYPPPVQPTTNSVIISSADPMTYNNQVSTWDEHPHGSWTEVKTADVMNIQYLSNFQYIGVKRPELFDAYREYYRDDIEGNNPTDTSYSWRNLNAPQCLTGMPFAFRATCPFITTIEWTPENLLKVKAVFDAQAKYPELFTGYSHSNVELNDSEYKSGTANGNGVSSDYMRFIHINSFNGYYPTMRGHQATAGPGATSLYANYYYYKSTSGRVQLGDDNTNQPLTHEGTDRWHSMNPSRNAEDFSSAPLFVWYNDVDKDNTDNDGDQHQGLAYGTMWKYTSGEKFFDGFPLNGDVATATTGKSYIAFNTKKIGGIPDFIFNNMDDDFWTFGGETRGKGIGYPIGGDFGDAGSGRGCGFDIHFNAYGTSCIALYSGYLSGDKYAVETLKSNVSLPDGVKGEYYYNRGCCLPATLQLEPREDNATTNAAIDNSATVKVGTSDAAYAGPNVYCLFNSYIHDVPVKDRMIIAQAAGEYTLSGKVTMPTGTNVYIHKILIGTPTYGNRNISKFIRERYVGANSPLLAFDDKGERFNFQQLHTPIYVGNEANAGDGLTSVAETGGTAVVEINRRLLGNDFSPEMMPYGTPIQPTKVASDADDKTPPVQPMNLNLMPWQLYDSDGGIFLENFGLSEDQWKLSLWGVLGFSYAQFNVEDNNRQSRINNIVDGSAGGSITTNANLEASDVVKFRGNRYGTSLYTNQPPIASVLGDYANATDQPNVDYPVISIDQTSAQVSAQNLPRKMLRPYFLIKSNIIGDMNYFGGSDSGYNLPIVCVVNKENGFGDFYFQRGFDLEFTITHPKILTSITTSIHDPDMRLSNVSGDSAVIFKITKQNNANLDVVQDVLQQQQNVMMRHAEALRVAQEEAIREQVRNGVDISDIDGVAAGAGDDVMMPPTNTDPPAEPAMPAGSVVDPTVFQQALAAMAPPPPDTRTQIQQLGGDLPTEDYGPPPLPQGEQAAEEMEDSGAPIGSLIPATPETPGIMNTAFYEGAPPLFNLGLSPISSRESSAPATTLSDPAITPREGGAIGPPREELPKAKKPKGGFVPRAVRKKQVEEEARRHHATLTPEKQREIAEQRRRARASRREQATRGHRPTEVPKVEEGEPEPEDPE
jgi:hypothetical protein